MKKYRIIAQSFNVGYNVEYAELSDSARIDDYIKEHHVWFEDEGHHFVCEVYFCLPSGKFIFHSWRVYIYGALYTYEMWRPAACSLRCYFEKVEQFGIKL